MNNLHYWTKKDIHPSFFAPIMIATLLTCAQLERDNFIKLQNKRKSHCVYA